MKVFHAQNKGREGNIMLQLMVALSVQEKYPDCRLSNIDLPMWNIKYEALPTTGRVSTVRGQLANVTAIAALLQSPEIDQVQYEGYGVHVGNFLSREYYKEVFQPPDPKLKARGYGDNYLVVNIRADDILAGKHRDYVLTPIEYYQELADTTNLEPVFMGQITDNPYIDELKKKFKACKFQRSQGVLEDFHTLRYSANIVSSVSTFSWLACFLSEARKIYIPLLGLLNPFQRHDCNLVYEEGDIFQYTLFPFVAGANIEKYHTIYPTLKERRKEITAGEVTALLAERFGQRSSLDDYIPHFDGQFYLKKNPDVAAEIASGVCHNALDHYVHTGYKQGRAGFFLDASYYTAMHPDAAEAVGYGEYLDLHEHFVKVGCKAGYGLRPERKPRSLFQRLIKWLS